MLKVVLKLPLVDDLLDVSRITLNKLNLTCERVELKAIILSAVETSRSLIDDLGHSISLTLPPTPVFLDADFVRLSQVFSNILNNSAKYTDTGGHITLTAEVIGAEVIVSVKDNGRGISADALSSIFDMFVQVDRKMQQGKGGLGIGLALVRRLVEMHNGTVECHSGGLGLGSEFIVRLPITK